MTVARYVVRQLQTWEIDVVFGVPGDTLLPLLNELRKEGSPRFIVCRNASSAALMACAYAKTTGKVSVCVADAGPATVQLLNGLYDARMDRVPLIAITGEPSIDAAGYQWLQNGDDVQLFRNVTAYNDTVSAANQTARVLSNAYRRAVVHGRPTRIGIARDVWGDAVGHGKLTEQVTPFASDVRTSERIINQAVARLTQAQRPVLFAGVGAAGAVQPLLHLAENLQAPIVHSLPAIGIIPGDSEWNMGVIGKFGTQAAADVLGRADVVFAVGTTWWQPEYVAEDAHVIQLDIAREHIGLAFPVDIGIWGDASDVLNRFVEQVEPADRSEWRQFVQLCRGELQEEVARMEQKRTSPLEPGAVMAAVGKALVRDAIVAIDVGNNTFWFSRYMQGPQLKVLMSGHWRTAGFSLPAAVAAKLAAPERQVVAISGDGGFGMSMAELATAVQYNLPIVCIVLNDGRYGEEATLSQAYNEHSFGTGLHRIDWAAYARACGAIGYNVRTYDELQWALHEALPALAAGKISVIDVAVAQVDPQHPLPARNERAVDGDFLPLPFQRERETELVGV